MRGDKLGLGIVGVCGLVLGAPSRAEACSCGPLVINELLLRDGRVPENAVGIPWWRHTEDELGDFDAERDAATQARAERWDGSAFVEVEVEIRAEGDLYLVVPTEGWSAGDLFRFAVRESPQPGEEPPPWAFQPVEVVDPLDEQLAPTLQATEPAIGERLLLDRGGSCALAHSVASVDVHLAWPVDSGALPVGALLYRTLVDGEPWAVKTSLCSTTRPGGNGPDVTQTSVHTSCGALPLETFDGQVVQFEATGAPSAGEGRHLITMEAWLPGTDLLFRDEVEVQLQCPPTPEPPNSTAPIYDSPVPAADRTARGATAGLLTPGSATRLDAGQASPTQSPTGDLVVHGIELEPKSSGCSVNHAPSAPVPRSPGSLALLGALLAALRRRLPSAPARRH